MQRSSIIYKQTPASSPSEQPSQTCIFQTTCMLSTSISNFNYYVLCWTKPTWIVYITHSDSQRLKKKKPKNSCIQGRSERYIWMNVQRSMFKASQIKTFVIYIMPFTSTSIVHQSNKSLSVTKTVLLSLCKNNNLKLWTESERKRYQILGCQDTWKQ